MGVSMIDGKTHDFETSGSSTKNTKILISYDKQIYGKDRAEQCLQTENTANLNKISNKLLF